MARRQDSEYGGDHNRKAGAAKRKKRRLNRIARRAWKRNVQGAVRRGDRLLPGTGRA